MKNLLLIISITLFSFLGFSQGSQYFEDVILPTSYEDGDFTESGITYTYGQCRDQDEFPISGQGLMLRKPLSSYFEWTIPNGIGTLTFEYRKAFTGGTPRQLEVQVNGVVVATTDEFGEGSGEQADIYTFSHDINQGGSVTIKIKNVGDADQNKQSIIDNIEWTLGAAGECDGYVASIEGDLTFCEDNMTTLTATANETIASVVWGDGSTDTELTVFSSGTYTAVITSEDECVAEVSVEVMEIGQPSMNEIMVEQLPDGSTNFSVVDPENVDTYAWDFGDGSTSTDESPTHTYTEAGNYTVTITISNECGQVTKTADITSTVGITENKIVSVKLYPNPVQNQLNLKSETVINKVEIYNVLGEEVFSKNINKNNTQINTESFRKGIYLLRVSSNGEQNIYKFVKK